MIDRDQTMQVIIEESQDHETTFDMSQMDRTQEQNQDGTPVLPSDTESNTHHKHLDASNQGQRILDSFVSKDVSKFGNQT